MRIDLELIAKHNQLRQAASDADYQALGDQLQRSGIDIETLTARVEKFGVAIPSWGVGTGGTRFARFPGLGEPRHVFDKLDDCGVIQQLTKATPRVSLHIPWDDEDPTALKEKAVALGLGFDAMNSNTFQDQQDQTHSYKYGSLSHTSVDTREQAVAHNIRCIEIGKTLGSKALTVWVGDGSNFPGQTNMYDQFDRYIDAMKRIYAETPDDWQLFIEHKIYEPAFYSTVVQDWGSSYLTATELGEKAKCLVDLGHHAPSVNIEMIVSRLARFGKLGGFHFNDSKYGDDDLDSGAIDPFRLFLVFAELIDIENRQGENFQPAYMLDQSHNVTDPIESLMTSAIEVQRAFVQASIIDREALSTYQSENDALMAAQTLKNAFRTNVDPILQRARQRQGGAIDPIGAYRESKYRKIVTEQRPQTQGSSSGIV